MTIRKSGAELVTRFSGEKAKTQEVSSDTLAGTTRRCALWFGSSLLAISADWPGVDGPEPAQDDPRFQRTDIRMDSWEEGVAVISFSQGCAPGQKPWVHRVWIDPRPLTLLKQEITIPEGASYAETFSNIRIGNAPVQRPEPDSALSLLRQAEEVYASAGCVHWKAVVVDDANPEDVTEIEAEFRKDGTFTIRHTKKGQVWRYECAPSGEVTLTGPEGAPRGFDYDPGEASQRIRRLTTRFGAVLPPSILLPEEDPVYEDVQGEACRPVDLALEGEEKVGERPALVLGFWQPLLEVQDDGDGGEIATLVKGRLQQRVWIDKETKQVLKRRVTIAGPSGGSFTETYSGIEIRPVSP